MDMGHLETALTELHAAIEYQNSFNRNTDKADEPAYCLGDLALDDSHEAGKV